MGYIGNSPANVGNFQVVDDISSTFNGTLTSFALTALTLPINPAKSGQLLVSINGVLQEPDDTGTEGFKVSGSNIVFSSAPATSSTFWAVWQGQAVDIGTPSDNTVGNAQVADNALSGNKIDGGTISNFTSTGIDDNATSTAITIDASENVGIGVVPESWYSSHTALQVGGLATFTGDTSASAGSSTRVLNNSYLNSGGSWRYQITDEASFYGQYDGTHSFRVAPSGTADTAISWTTAMTIANNGYVGFGVAAPTTMIHLNGGTAGPTNSGVAAAWNVHSDYRLKENVVPMVGAIDRLKNLKPCRFNWNFEEGTPAVDGFLAHEVGEVVPEAESGTKDAMMDEEYEVTPAVMDGETVVTEAVMGTRSVPDYQGIDQSKLVPLLVASLQEAVAKIEALEARVTALEV